MPAPPRCSSSGNEMASWRPTLRPASTRTGWSTATTTGGRATHAASSARSGCPPRSRSADPRQRCPAPRTDAAEDEVGPAVTAAVDAGQRRPDLGSEPRHGAHRSARRRDAALLVRRQRRCAPRPRRDRRSGDDRSDQRSRARRAARARRRSSSVRDRVQLPRRAPGRGHRRSRRRRDHVPGRGAGRRRAVDRAHPPAARPAARCRHPDSAGRPVHDRRVRTEHAGERRGADRPDARTRCDRRRRRPRARTRDGRRRGACHCAARRAPGGRRDGCRGRRGDGRAAASRCVVAVPPRCRRRCCSSREGQRVGGHPLFAGDGRPDPRGRNRGARMPQKTTFFSPKPRTGMVFRALD